MHYAGIDIGSTASKVVVLDDAKQTILHRKLVPSGWNSKETGESLREWLKSLGYERDELRIVATGYGRVSVPFADRSVTEITCHGKGAFFLCHEDTTVIDIGGQDTKVILLENGTVSDFLMNDKCSAGTGKFLEVMANRLGLSLQEMLEEARRGNKIAISSTCTVFAESEIISLMGQGTPRADLAAGVVHSICDKVAALVLRKPPAERYFLTGGFCDSAFLIDELSKRLGAPVSSHPDGRFAGAIGAALVAY